VTGTEVVGNRLLAARASDLAGRAPRGSLECKAAGCAAVALSESRTVPAARKVLALLWQADIRAAALQLLDQLAAKDAKDANTAPPGDVGTVGNLGVVNPAAVQTACPDCHHPVRDGEPHTCWTDERRPTQDEPEEKSCGKCGGPLEIGRRALCVACHLGIERAASR
jgi:hypothetical protein